VVTNIGQVRPRVRVRASADHRKLAVAVRQCLGGQGQPLFRPGGVAERAVGADLDGLALGVDLAGPLPVLADGVIGQPGIVGCHFSGVVVEYFLPDVLGDITVDQDRSQRVPPLMGVRCTGCLCSSRTSQRSSQRAGLIDMFYYDAEEFWFHDGRLLLRGNNGTGKSKGARSHAPVPARCRLAPEPGQAQLLLGQVAAVLARLPSRGIPIGRLAAECCGDAHALDDRHPAGTLALSAVRALVGQAFAADGTADSRRGLGERRCSS
jgi:hypothetical protein